MFYFYQNYNCSQCSLVTVHSDNYSQLACIEYLLSPMRLDLSYWYLSWRRFSSGSSYQYYEPDILVPVWVLPIWRNRLDKGMSSTWQHLKENSARVLDQVLFCFKGWSTLAFLRLDDNVSIASQLWCNDHRDGILSNEYYHMFTNSSMIRNTINYTFRQTLKFESCRSKFNHVAHIVFLIIYFQNSENPNMVKKFLRDCL